MGNKSFSRRISRWVDRLLLFEFEVVHAAGRILGIADYLSRHPSKLDGLEKKAKKLSNEWFTENSVNSWNDFLEDNAQPRDKSTTAEIASEKAIINHVKEVKSKRPIRSRETRISRESSKLN